VKPARFLLFSNEAVGLGHLKRALAITGHLARTEPEATSLIVTGSPAQALFELPPRVDVMSLPTLMRDEAGGHRARRLALEARDAGRLRGSIACAAALAFEPDCAVVDRLPLGLEGELAPALEALRASGCKLVLGLRDIENDPLEVRRTWEPELRDAILRFYDLVLVYGPASPALDAIDCLDWNGGLPVPVHHVGYVGGGTSEPGPADLPGDYVLATVGGGSDGFAVLSTFLEALRLAPLPLPALVITGPLMPRNQTERLEELAAGLDAEVWRFRPNLEALIARARAVVCMAGYNTVAEVLGARRPALLVPRVTPITEQLVRALELGRRGLQDVLHPDELSPATMRVALDRLLARPRPRFEDGDYGGAERAAGLLAGLVATNGRRPTARPAA
jgi:predicted glycosyltransferase